MWGWGEGVCPQFGRVLNILRSDEGPEGNQDGASDRGLGCKQGEEVTVQGPPTMVCAIWLSWEAISGYVRKNVICASDAYIHNQTYQHLAPLTQNHDLAQNQNVLTY